jgi:hypothetical protein
VIATNFNRKPIRHHFKQRRQTFPRIHTVIVAQPGIVGSDNGIRKFTAPSVKNSYAVVYVRQRTDVMELTAA